MATLASAFSDSSLNATITLKIPSGNLVTDATTGNVYPETVNSAIVVVMSQKNTPTTPYPGVDATAIYAEGWCENPTKFPTGTQFNKRYPIAWGTRTGEFLLLESTVNPYALKHSAMLGIRGQKVRGYFFATS